MEPGTWSEQSERLWELASGEEFRRRSIPYVAMMAGPDEPAPEDNLHRTFPSSTVPLAAGGSRVGSRAGRSVFARAGESTRAHRITFDRNRDGC